MLEGRCPRARLYETPIRYGWICMGSGQATVPGDPTPLCLVFSPSVLILPKHKRSETVLEIVVAI